MTKLGLLDTKINELHQSFDKIILTPRLTSSPDHTTAAILADADEIKVTGRMSDSSIRDLFQDIDSIIDYLSTRLPPSIAVPLSGILMPSLTFQLITKWLVPSVPSSLDDMQEFQETLAQVLKLAEVLESVEWHGKADLLDWVDQAPRVWLTKRRETSLDKVRTLLAKGLGDVKMVERVETETVSAGDEMFHGNGGGDDWNAEWSDGEDSKKRIATSTRQDEEDDASAWGLDDNPDDNEMPSKDADVPKSTDEGASADAWGWGDDNEQEEPVRSDRVDVNKQVLTSNGHVPNAAKQPKREVSLKEVYSITALPEEVLEVITQVVADAETLAQSKYVSFTLSVVALSNPTAAT